MHSILLSGNKISNYSYYFNSQKLEWMEDVCTQISTETTGGAYRMESFHLVTPVQPGTVLHPAPSPFHAATWARKDHGPAKVLLLQGKEASPKISHIPARPAQSKSAGQICTDKLFL